MEGYDTPPHFGLGRRTLVQSMGIDVGGIEYWSTIATGGSALRFNALSNFVADAANVIGFDPHVRLVDYLTRGGARG